MTGDIGKVYSQALFEIALESGCLDEINSEMGQCRTVSVSYTHLTLPTT